MALLVEYSGQTLFFFTILILIFNLIIFLVSLREKKNELLNSQENLKNIEEIAHS